MTTSHTLVAEACLGILLYLDKEVVTKDSLQKSRLAESEHWADHDHLENAPRNVEDEAIPPYQIYLMVCVRIYDLAPIYEPLLTNENPVGK